MEDGSEEARMVVRERGREGREGGRERGRAYAMAQHEDNGCIPRPLLCILTCKKEMFKKRETGSSREGGKEGGREKGKEGGNERE